MTAQGLVLVKSNEDLNSEALHAFQMEREAEARRESALETSLAAHIRRRWEVMRRHKEPIEQRMLSSLRQISGRYSDEKVAQIKKEGLPAIYMQITAVKCRAAKSWIRDVLLPAGDRPWEIKPTKSPSMPQQEELALAERVKRDAMEFMQVTGQQLTPEIMQEKFEEVRDKLNEKLRKEAKRKCARMADEIENQLLEGDWERALDEVISDVVDYPAGIMKGPVMRHKRKLAWGDGGELDVVDEIQPEVERVDPFSFYMSPGAVTPDEGDCIQVHEYTADDLYDLIGLPGYDEESIREALREYNTSGHTHWTRDALRSSKERARGQFSGTQSEEDYIEALEWWGSVQGQQLIDWGRLPEEVPDAEAMYDVMAVMVGRHVICVRFNPDPLGSKPYSKACFEDVPGAFWGKGVPDLIRDCQDICNAAARALVANLGISSGPQVAVNTASLAAGQDAESMYPWKIWQLDFAKTGANAKPPIHFFQPNSMTKELMAVYKEFSQLADEYSGIPSYTYGLDNTSGAGRTASGLSMLMNAASKAIKNVIRHLDTGVIQRVVNGYYVHNMLWHPDRSIKGDAQVRPRGAMSLVTKEQNQLRLQELLKQTANPVDMEILGTEGRAAMLRHTMQGVDVGADNVVPSDEELQRRQMIRQMEEQRRAQAEQPNPEQPQPEPHQGPM